MMLRKEQILWHLNHLSEAQPTSSFKLLNAIFLQLPATQFNRSSQSSSNHLHHPKINK